MDLDAFVAAHRGDWDRLDELCRRRHLTGAEADEILDRYQRVATHLSLVRSTTPDPSLVAYLSMLLARARSRSAGSRAMSWSDVGRFFGQSFPPRCTGSAGGGSPSSSSTSCWPSPWAGG